jgi:hypothetical protein
MGKVVAGDQPHVAQDYNTDAAEDGDWTLLDLPGPNRFLNVLICLKWWRERLEGETKKWRDAVEDVKWVLE